MSTSDSGLRCSLGPHVVSGRGTVPPALQASWSVALYSRPRDLFLPSWGSDVWCGRRVMLRVMSGRMLTLEGPCGLLGGRLPALTLAEGP